MATGMPGQDPGWGGKRGMLLLLVPGMLARRARTSANALVTMRQVWQSFVMFMLLIAVVVFFLHSDADRKGASLSPATAGAVVFLLGFAAVAVSRMVQRRLPCDSAAALLEGYRTRFFIRMALAESAGLIGFVGTFLALSPLPYLAGLAPALIGMSWLAPTARNLQREQEEQLALGCPYRLYDILLGLLPPEGPVTGSPGP